MEGLNKCPFYNETTRTLYMPKTIQTKFDNELKRSGYVTLHEFYVMLAESLPEDMREEFLENLDRPWCENDKVGFSLVFSQNVNTGIIVVDFNTDKEAL